MSAASFNIGLKGTAKPRSVFGFVVGSEIEVSWELTNLDNVSFPGGMLSVVMMPPNGQFVKFDYKIDPLPPKGKVIVDKNPNGNRLKTNVLAEGFTLFSASMQNATLYSPPGVVLQPQYSFLSFLGKSMDEIYTKYGLIVAAAGLIGTVVIGTIQLLTHAY